MSASVEARSQSSPSRPVTDRSRTMLMVAYHFPPDREVGALRPAKIARSFRGRGYAVNVIAGPGEQLADDEGFAVRRIAPSLDLRALYSRVTRSRQTQAGSQDAAPANAGASWVPPERVPRWKRWISSLLWLPDDRQGWIPAAARAAIRDIRNGASILYTTAPPHSVLLVGLLAKRRTGVFWVLEFRDPWIDNPWKPAFVRSRWSDAAERWLERRCLDAADLIVTVTESLADRLRARLPARLHDRIIVIRNGIDDLAAPPAPAGARGTVELLYVGNLYHGRDPRPLFLALASLDRHGSLPAGARVEFIGDCETFKGVPLAGMLEEYGLRDRVVLRGRIPHAECLRRIAAADLLLLFAQDQPLQVPNKLYEYLGARRPIVAFVDAGGESEQMLDKVGGHYIIASNEPERIEQILEAAFRNAHAHRAMPREELLEEWTTDRQIAALYEALAARLP